MNYKVIERKAPRNPEAPGKYYGFIVNLSKIGIEEIATRISGTCTVTRHDCLAVLSALQEQIICDYIQQLMLKTGSVSA